MNRLFLILFFSLLSFTLSFAQKKLKFGKIDRADLTMNQYPSDSSAAAAFLYDNGYSELKYEKSQGEFFVVFERHLRIKIFNKSGLDWADFSIPLYKNNSDKERISFKAITHSLINGKIEETKVGKKELLIEEMSENKSVAKIAMTKVQEGSIIEIKYAVRSPFYWNLWDWQFQYDIPVRYSSYRIDYPEWFQYNIKFKGYDLQYIESLKLEPDQRSILFSQTQRTGTYNFKSTHVNSKIDYKRMRFGWIATEMPAFVPEAYISSKSNFLVKVDFELGSTSFPNRPWKSYTQTWVDLNKTLLNANSFGKQITKKRTKFLSDDVKAVTSNLNSLNEKINALYYHVKSKIAWNNKYGKFITSTLKDTYKNGKGNIADINLTLLGMLRQANIEAYPVILSTKKHGFLNAAFPSLSQFNYVIVSVKLENGKVLLLDATSVDLPLHLLPPRCINEKGLVVKENGVHWAALTPNGKFNRSHLLNLKLNENMEWEGSMKVRCKDYAADIVRHSINEKENEASYITSLESEYEGLSIHNFSVEGVTEIDRELMEQCDVTFNNQIMDGNDLLYFNPMLTFGKEENPFKLKERTYPIDFPYPFNTVYSANFEVPEGYTIDEVPEKIAISLPDKGGFFSYSVEVQNKKILVLSRFKINKHLFLPSEYAALKEFYNIMVEKHAEQVVLKKT